MKVPRPLNKKNALTQEFAQGCTIVMNEAARMLVTRIEPDRRAIYALAKATGLSTSTELKTRKN